MPAQGMILILLVGIVFGGIAAVFLRSKSSGFLVNIILGVLGGALGAYLPVLIGSATRVDISTFDYLLRAVMGSFLLVLIGSLFRSAKPRH